MLISTAASFDFDFECWFWSQNANFLTLITINNCTPPLTPCFKEFHFWLVRGAITTKQEAQAVVANDDSSLDRVAAAMLILNDENAEEKAPRVVKKNKFKLSPRKRKRRSAPDDNSRPNKRRGNKPGDNNGDNDPADMIDE